MSQRGSAGGDWRLTLQAGDTLQAARRLFIGRLGWSSGSIASLRSIQVIEGPPEESNIGVSGIDHRLDLMWRCGGRLTRLTIDRDQPSPMQIRCMERLAWEGFGDPLDIVKQAFDASRYGADFAMSAAEIVQKHAGVKGRRSGRERLRLAHLGVRFCLLKMLESRGWARFGNGGYLERLWEVHQREPEPYSMTQRIALACESALIQPSSDARLLLRRLVGDLPFLGPCLFSSLIEDDNLPEPPTEFFVEFIHLCSQFDFCLDEPGPDMTRIGVTPENVAHFAAAALDRPAPQDVIALRTLARKHVEGAPQDADKLIALAAPCGWGDHLLAMLAEIAQNRNPRPHLQRQIRGLTEDSIELSVTRLRLLARCLAGDPDSAPEPVYGLDSTVIDGRAVMPEHLGPPPTLSKYVPAASATIAYRPWLLGDDQIRIVKLIAAFMNADGGTIYAGVDDHGQPLPAPGNIARDIVEPLISKSLTTLWPQPGSLVRTTVIKVDEVPILRIDVSPASKAVYFLTQAEDDDVNDKLYVRAAGRTRLLTGHARERFVQERR